MCNITTRITGDYGSIVGTSDDDKLAFHTSMTEQLANLLNVEKDRIRDVESSSGSVVVDFTLVAYDGEDEGEYRKSFDDLQQQFEDGEVG